MRAGFGTDTFPGSFISPPQRPWERAWVWLILLFNAAPIQTTMEGSAELPRLCSIVIIYCVGHVTKRPLRPVRARFPNSKAPLKVAKTHP